MNNKSTQTLSELNKERKKQTNKKTKKSKKAINKQTSKNLSKLSNNKTEFTHRHRAKCFMFKIPRFLFLCSKYKRNLYTTTHCKQNNLYFVCLLVTVEGRVLNNSNSHTQFFDVAIRVCFQRSHKYD